MMDRKLRGIITRQLEQDEQFPEGYIRAEYTEHIRPVVVGSLCDEVDRLRESLNRLREWYNDSQAEMQRTRNALGDLLARITLGECPLCGAIPAQAHQGGCPVPKALEVWDGDPPELARWEGARERWRNDPGYGDNELSFINYLTDHGFEFEA